MIVQLALLYFVADPIEWVPSRDGFYVDASSNYDDADGSPSRPFRTVREAWERAGALDLPGFKAVLCTLDTDKIEICGERVVIVAGRFA